ncbi:MAG: hypothetical protein Q9169_004298 [Polycauliona sp. 2 TL-2023]
MPAPKGGIPRKGRLGKKAQLERMFEASKKAASKPPKTSPKQSNASKQVLQAVPKANANATLVKICEDTKNLDGAQNTSLVVGKPSTNLIDLDRLPKPATIQAQSVPQLAESGDGTVTIRLSCLPLKCFPTKKTLPHRRPTQLPVPKPTPSKNPNRVVLRLPPTQKPGATTFLSLARELRNQIYDYALPYNKYRIQCIPRDTQRPTELTYSLPLNNHWSPNLTAETGRLRRDFDLPKRVFVEKEMPRYRLSPGPAALLLVSRQVNTDVAPMFYGRNTFSFATMKPLQKFMGNLRPMTRSMIRSLELIHSTASNTRLRIDQKWKKRHDQSWESLCFQIRDDCDRLEDLTLDLYIKDLPFKLGPEAGWMSPLYAFMGLRNLRHIDVRLHQREADDAILMLEAYKIRQALMGDNFYQPIHNPGNMPLLENPRPNPRRAHPGVNALRVTVGNRRVPASCIKPSLGPRATTFWTPPTPTYREQGKEIKALNHPDDRNGKGKGKEVIKTPLTWTPPATLIGTAIKAQIKPGESKPHATTDGSYKAKGIATDSLANATSDNKTKRAFSSKNADTRTHGSFRRMRKAIK